MNPMRAPHVQYVDQLHGAPVSGCAGQPATLPTILATNTAIMPPAAKPATAVKQPIPR